MVRQHVHVYAVMLAIQSTVVVMNVNMMVNAVARKFVKILNVNQLATNVVLVLNVFV